MMADVPSKEIGVLDIPDDQIDPDKTYSLEGIIASVLFILLLVVTTIQVLGRTAIMTGPVWTEELARWLWVWMALIGIGEVERTNTQLRMGFIADALPDGPRRWLATLIDVIWVAAMVQLAWLGWKSILRTWSNTSVTLPVTDAVLYGSFLAASVFIIFRTVMRVVGRHRAIEGQP